MKNKGGAPSVVSREHHNKMQALGIFNRDSSVYLAIETELESLPEAKAFDLFCHYCARRDRVDAYNLVQDTPERLEIIVNLRKNMIRDNEIKESLFSLSNLSEHTFVLFMDILYYDYILSQSNNTDDTNNFSFEITASFSLKYLSRFYSREQNKNVYEYLFLEHLKEREELAKIYTESTDKASIKALHTLLVLNEQRVNIMDVVNNLRSPFYLKDRSILEDMLKVDRYKDIKYAVSEIPPKNSARPMSYQPNTTLNLNMDKPIKYIQEMLLELKSSWVENNDYLGIEEQKKNISLLELRHSVMSFRKRQKTLAGKLTDLLYVYDNKCFGFTEPWITNQIYRYWKKKKPKGNSAYGMSSSTFNMYYKQISTMIQEKHYKHF